METSSEREFPIIQVFFTGISFFALFIVLSCWMQDQGWFGMGLFVNWTGPVKEIQGQLIDATAGTASFILFMVFIRVLKKYAPFVAAHMNWISIMATTMFIVMPYLDVTILLISSQGLTVQPWDASGTTGPYFVIHDTFNNIAIVLFGGFILAAILKEVYKGYKGIKPQTAEE